MTSWTEAEFNAFLARGRMPATPRRPENPSLPTGTRRIVLVVEGCIHPSLNALNRRHWAVRAKEKGRWEEQIRLLALEAKWRKPPMEKARVRIRYYCGDTRRRDKDNYNPKFICDGLVKAGILADDNARVVDLDWELLPGGPRRTEIEVQEVRGKCPCPSGYT